MVDSRLKLVTHERKSSNESCGGVYNRAHPYITEKICTKVDQSLASALPLSKQFISLDIIYIHVPNMSEGIWRRALLKSNFR